MILRCRWFCSPMCTRCGSRWQRSWGRSNWSRRRSHGWKCLHALLPCRHWAITGH